MGRIKTSAKMLENAAIYKKGANERHSKPMGWRSLPGAQPAPPKKGQKLDNTLPPGTHRDYSQYCYEEGLARREPLPFKTWLEGRQPPAASSPDTALTAKQPSHKEEMPMGKVKSSLAMVQDAALYNSKPGKKARKRKKRKAALLAPPSPPAPGQKLSQRAKKRLNREKRAAEARAARPVVIRRPKATSRAAFVDGLPNTEEGARHGEK